MPTAPLHSSRRRTPHPSSCREDRPPPAAIFTAPASCSSSYLPANDRTSEGNRGMSPCQCSAVSLQTHRHCLRTLRKDWFQSLRRPWQATPTRDSRQPRRSDRRSRTSATAKSGRLTRAVRRRASVRSGYAGASSPSLPRRPWRSQSERWCCGPAASAMPKRRAAQWLFYHLRT